MIIKCVLVDFRHGILNYRKPKSQAFWLKGPIPIFNSFFCPTHDVSVTKSCCCSLPNTSNTSFPETIKKVCFATYIVGISCIKMQYLNSVMSPQQLMTAHLFCQLVSVCGQTRKGSYNVELTCDFCPC